MKPASFRYHAPESVDDVIALLSEHGDEAKPLAGGQSLVPMLAMRLTRFEHLVDLNRVAELSKVTRANGSLVVGAMVRQATLERAPETASIPLLGRALPLIGHFQIRNRGTIGGSIAHADPAGELPALVLAHDAMLEVVSTGGRRMVPARDFFLSTWTTVLDDAELLVNVHLPVWKGRCGFAVEEVARRHGDFAITGAMCGVALGDAGAVERVSIAMFGMGSTPVRATRAEDALLGSVTDPGDIDAAARLAVTDLDPPEDLHASSAYRRHVGTNVVRSALSRAIEEAAHV
jgi:aerobic carbon-monoxide dehydrogenase medium subunit